MKILALDTSTEACSAALLHDGQVFEQYALTPREHTQMILPMVRRVLAEAGLDLNELDGIAFARGPGAFTGLRIAAGVTQGLALGANLPVMPVSSLAALAHGVWRVHGADKVLTALDARMHEVYWGAWRVLGEGRVVLDGEERVLAPTNAPLPDAADWFAAGSGWSAYADTLLPRFSSVMRAHDAEILPCAHDVALIAAHLVAHGAWQPALDAQPVYLRDNVADKPKQLLL
ncbi:MAG: tRNA (adenosine(37)-N6)-threonylcarbamoyltransferase complex dimerization subunit type 1 TsaB [Halothiobacillaceae bacterium]